MYIPLHKAMFFRRAPADGMHSLPQNASDGFDLDAALAFALALIRALQDAHGRSDWHPAICPANVRMHDTGLIELRSDASVPLAYISPEQTGRMNRRVDYRSDYYSLGVILYEFLAGRLPFDSDNVMELVHGHIAKKPAPPININPDLPKAVSDIILKLLAKNAEDRYQSLDGLLADMLRCRTALAGGGELAPFALGESDRSDRLQFPQKLYGRESETVQLLEAFNRVAEGGAELLLVTGYSGIGKSSLVHEVYKPVVNRRGYFISGKFDQFKRSLPYSAINHALRELMRQILTESESRIAHWKEKLHKALGPNGQMVIDAIPELEYIIGKQAAVPQLNGARNSYNYVMQKFVGVFTRPEHPLVLFLDDLQWADGASLKLINMLMRGLDDPCLLLIGAYRSNEVEATHPLAWTINDIRKEARVSTMEINALSQASIAELVADMVKASGRDSMPLARLVYGKTLGNPFFVAQFLKSLYNERLLKFEKNNWFWNIAEIEALAITDNVADLLTKELQRLPDATRHLLTLAACIGNRFDIRTLATVSEMPEDDAKTILQQAIQAGLIRVSETGVAPSAPTLIVYYFLHDRVQQAAYEGIPEKQRKAVHLKIGRLLLKSMPAGEREERIFDIVYQLNEGRQLLTQTEDKDELARLNLAAAKKARTAAAFDVHREFAEIANEFGTAATAPLRQTSRHEFYLELIHAAFARADYTEMERICRIASDASMTVQEAIAAKEMLIRCYGAMFKPQELQQTGIELLALSGIAVPARLGERHILLARLKLKLAMRGRGPLALAGFPPATDPAYLLQLEATRTFLGYGLLLLADSKLVLWVVLEMVRKSLQYGVSPLCAYAYAIWGRTLAGKLDRHVEGFEFGKLAAGIAPEKNLLGAVGIYHGVIRHHREHLRLSLQPLLDTYRKAMETGDRAGAVLALQYSDAIRFQSGARLDEGLVHLRKDIDFYRKMDYPALLDIMIPWALLFAALAGESVADISQGRSMESFVEARRNVGDNWAIFYVRAVQGIDAFYFGNHSSALAHAEEAIGLPAFEFGSPMSAFMMFFYSLSQLAVCREHPERTQAAVARAAAMQRRFRSLAQQAPMNYLHKWHLVEAELCRALDRPAKAAEHFARAIAGARENGFPGDEALANELAGRFHLGRNDEPKARMHLEEAHAKYAQWGAFGKLAQLCERYPDLLARVTERRLGDDDRRAAPAEQRLDIATIIKASQTLSGEIQLDRLLEKLMLLLVENAGAQRGVLLLQKDGALAVQARAHADAIEVMQGTPLEESTDLSLAVVNYVRRTREKVVVGDAETDMQFRADPYIRQARPKSILCIPLHKQSELVGILYLENNLAADAFTAEHTALLEILSTQIAISLENAGLYYELEQKVVARTRALSSKNSELKETLKSLKQTQKQLVESEKLASLGQLVAGVAHEINTPVGVAVTGASTLAEQTARLNELYQSGALKRSDLDHYVESASTISRLLLSNMERAAALILSFKEVAIDQTSDERRVFGLKAYIDDVLLNLSPLLRKTGHQITVDCDDAIEMDSYPGALSQTLTNFVMNALLHAFEEGECGRMAIVVQAFDDGFIELRFSDNGKGIPAEYLAKIFDPFFTTMRGRGGSGLGLNIIHNLVTGTLRGQISVESSAGAGTVFILDIPRNPVLNTRMAAANDARHRAGS